MPEVTTGVGVNRPELSVPASMAAILATPLVVLESTRRSEPIASALDQKVVVSLPSLSREREQY
jgi:hypothetical protein